MKFTLLVPSFAAVLGLAACAQGPNPAMGGGTPGPGTPPISNAGASSSAMPQTANSLPAGDRVNAPVSSSTGVVSTTRTR